MKRNLSLLAVLATLAVLTTLTGCTSTKVANAPNASVGQQLIDLDRSYKEGIITQKEYEKLKKEIIRKND